MKMNVACSLAILACLFCSSYAQISYECPGTNCGICLAANGMCFGCQTGSYPSPDNTRDCLLCRAAHCVSCNGEDSCTECADGYARTADGECERCQVDNCDYCSGSSLEQCQFCSSGYRLSVDGSCTPCTDNHCLLCMADENVCTNCGNGYTLVGDACEPTEIPNCLNGYDETTCGVCRDGFGVDASGGCSPCSTGCLSCSTDIAYCSECAVGFGQHNGGCEPCADNQCTRCNQGVCSGCNPGYDLITGSDVDGGAFCSVSSCQIDNCIACAYQDNTMCANCARGYFVNDGVCQACSNSDLCEHCIQEDTCQICKSGATLDGETMTCTVNCGPQSENCLVCADDFSGCVQCREGYEVDPANPTSCIEIVGYPDADRIEAELNAEIERTRQALEDVVQGLQYLSTVSTHNTALKSELAALKSAARQDGDDEGVAIYDALQDVEKDVRKFLTPVKRAADKQLDAFQAHLQDINTEFPVA